MKHLDRATWALTCVFLVVAVATLTAQPAGTLAPQRPTITIQPSVPFPRPQSIIPYPPLPVPPASLWNWHTVHLNPADPFVPPNFTQNLFAERINAQGDTVLDFKTRTQWAIAHVPSPPGAVMFSAFQRSRDAIVNTEGADLIVTNLTAGASIRFGTTSGITPPPGVAVVDSEVVTINHLGNVGIGERTPSARLSIIGAAGQPIDQSELIIRDRYTNKVYLQVYHDFVGIAGALNTHADGAKLAVNGKIKAKEIKVTLTNWPDYVFEDGYRLMPLTDVARYIEHHRHLPGIPAAAEVESGGVHLGEMQAKLLEKIEEMTLHLIEQDKRLSLQARRIQELEQTIESLTASGADNR